MLVVVCGNLHEHRVPKSSAGSGVYDGSPRQDELVMCLDDADTVC